MRDASSQPPRPRRRSSGAVLCNSDDSSCNSSPPTPPPSQIQRCPMKNEFGMEHETKDDERTTVIIKRLSPMFTRHRMVTMLDRHGLERQYNFVFMPISPKNRLSTGYAFINFVTHEAAIKFFKDFHGQKLPGTKSKKSVIVSWANVQGLKANKERQEGTM